ncbi:hypothetical protein O181_024359 [Austropuccinia psidii MF-1]|uniref:Uncharacterized protein n=1 Tax=Austropuccinia psidii MF-1 TaxID=1389203 RepID=A0A9Q3GZL5_9BASI|nr:hypothetical protein [Austropuccinia psidii MF-1]
MLSTRYKSSYNPSTSSRKAYTQDYRQIQSVTEGQGSADGKQNNKLCNYEADKSVFPSNRTEATEKSLRVHSKSRKKAFNNVLLHNKYQIIADLGKRHMRSYLTVRKSLGNTKTCKLLNGWNSFMEKKNIMLLKSEWRKNNPQSCKKAPKTTAVASRSNSNMKKKAKYKEKGDGKEPVTKPYRKGYRHINIQQYSR